MAREEAAPDRLGELLVARGYVTAAQLADAYEARRHRDVPLGQLLVETGVLTRLQLAGLLTEQWASPALSHTTPTAGPEVEPAAPGLPSPVQVGVPAANGRPSGPDPLLAARVDDLAARLDRLEASVDRLVLRQEDAAPRQTVEDLRLALRELWKVQKGLLEHDRGQHGAGAA
jgi:hypothetical protein